MQENIEKYVYFVSIYDIRLKGHTLMLRSINIGKCLNAHIKIENENML